MQEEKQVMGSFTQARAANRLQAKQKEKNGSSSTFISDMTSGWGVVTELEDQQHFLL